MILVSTVPQIPIFLSSGSTKGSRSVEQRSASLFVSLSFPAITPFLNATRTFLQICWDHMTRLLRLLRTCTSVPLDTIRLLFTLPIAFVSMRHLARTIEGPTCLARPGIVHTIPVIDLSQALIVGFIDCPSPPQDNNLRTFSYVYLTHYSQPCLLPIISAIPQYCAEYSRCFSCSSSLSPPRSTPRPGLAEFAFPGNHT